MIGRIYKDDAKRVTGEFPRSTSANTMTQWGYRPLLVLSL